MKTPTLFVLALLSATAVAGGLAMAQDAPKPETAKPEATAPAQTAPQTGGRGWGHRYHEGRGYGMGRGEGRGEHRGMGRGERRGEGRGEGRGFGRGASFDPAQLASRKTELGITPAQETVWKNFASALETFAEARKGREAIDRDKVRAMSADERQKFRTAMRESMQKNREAVVKAREALVATLSDEQKAKFPALTRTADQRGPRMGQGYGRGHGEMHGRRHGRDGHGRGHDMRGRGEGRGFGPRF